MAASRLILIEGMIGSGKTTTAEHLRDWLSARGEDVRAFHEGAADHPIRTRRVDELLAAPAPGGPDEYSASQWRRLAERCRQSDQTIILESVFLQNSVMPAFIDGAPAATVTGICTEIQCHRRAWTRGCGGSSRTAPGRPRPRPRSARSRTRASSADSAPPSRRLAQRSERMLLDAAVPSPGPVPAAVVFQGVVATWASASASSAGRVNMDSWLPGTVTGATLIRSAKRSQP